jgi:hypothetical protein
MCGFGWPATDWLIRGLDMLQYQDSVYEYSLCLTGHFVTQSTPSDFPPCVCTSHPRKGLVVSFFFPSSTHTIVRTSFPPFLCKKVWKGAQLFYFFNSTFFCAPKDEKRIETSHYSVIPHLYTRTSRLTHRDPTCVSFPHTLQYAVDPTAPYRGTHAAPSTPCARALCRRLLRRSGPVASLLPRRCTE